MFTWLNSQAVRSNRGFEVVSVDRFTIDYREKSRKVSVYVEKGIVEGRKPCVIISKNAFDHWDGTSAGERISPEKQQEMLSNFTEAMEFQGIKVLIE